MRSHITRTRLGIARALPMLAIAALAAFAPEKVWSQGSESFSATHTATLDGDQEVPSVTNAGSGLMVGRFDPVTKTLDYRLTVALPDGDMIAGAHLHAGGAGTSGLPIHTIVFDEGSKTAIGSWAAMSDQEIAALNAGGLYVDVHTSSNPNGQIRGEVMPIPNLGARNLTSGEETGPVTDSSATGQVFIQLDPAAHSLIYTVQWDGLTGPPTDAHFHRAPKGVAGDVIHPIDLPTNADSSGEVSGIWTGLSDATIADLIAGNIYVNLHTAKYPMGEARGQIYTTDVFTAFISPANETSDISESNALGTALFTLSGDGELLGVAEINSTTGPITEAHLHTGAKGENGDIYLPLIDFSFFTGPGSWLALKSGVTPDIASALRASGMYVNFHTDHYPNGEARGQLVPAATNLSLGSSSVPTPRGGNVAWNTWYDQNSGILHFAIDPARRDAPATVVLYSALGQRIATVPAEPGNDRVSIGMLPSGSYMAQMIVGGEVVGISRIGVVR